MKALIKLYIFLSFGIIGLISCNKYLTNNPKDTIVSDKYYGTDAELNAALGGVYSYLAQDGTFSRNLILELEMGNDEGQFNNRTNFQTYIHHKARLRSVCPRRIELML